MEPYSCTSKAAGIRLNLFAHSRLGANFGRYAGNPGGLGDLARSQRGIFAQSGGWHRDPGGWRRLTWPGVGYPPQLVTALTLRRRHPWTAVSKPARRCTFIWVLIPGKAGWKHKKNLFPSIFPGGCLMSSAVRSLGATRQYVCSDFAVDHQSPERERRVFLPARADTPRSRWGLGSHSWLHDSPVDR